MAPLSVLRLVQSRRCVSVPLSPLNGFQEPFEFAAAGRVPQFAQRFGFDLPDAFAGDVVLFANFLQRPRIAIGQTVTQLQSSISDLAKNNQNSGDQTMMPMMMAMMMKNQQA